MANRRRTLIVSAAQRAELEQVRDHDQRPYLRERAAALLKIAAGQSAHAVAVPGLLRPRQPDTVYAWLTRYQAQGLAGLVHHARGWRGFSPPQQRALVAVVHQSPAAFGLARPRWRLVDVRACPALPRAAPRCPALPRAAPRCPALPRAALAGAHQPFGHLGAAAPAGGGQQTRPPGAAQSRPSRGRESLRAGPGARRARWRDASRSACACSTRTRRAASVSRF